MNDPAPISHSDAAVEQQAAGWVLRQDRGLTAAEQDEYLQWLAADRRHKPAYARHRANWERLNVLAQWRPEHSRRPNRDLLAPAAGDRRRRIRFTRRWLVGAPLALAVALAVGFFLSNLTTPAPINPPAVAAPVATIEQRTLEDGSVIELNRGTNLTVLFTETERRVQLEQGEALFQVAKHPDRPFIVSARGVDVRAVGTVFNVRLEAASVEVLVTQGKVRVDDAVRGQSLLGAARDGEPPVLEAGQSATVPLAPSAVPQVATVTAADIERRLAWQPRLLDFSATPLQGIVDEFNRRNAPYRIVIAEDELSRIQVSASLRSDNVEGFIRLLEAGFGVRSDRVGNDIVLHRR